MENDMVTEVIKGPMGKILHIMDPDSLFNCDTG